MRRILSAFIILLVMITAGFAQPVSDALLDELRAAQDYERTFVIKSSEDQLTAKVRTMFSDPENAKDGYLWAMKVLANYYGFLTLVSEETGDGLGTFYRRKTDLAASFIRGEIQGEGLEEEERQIELQKGLYLEERLSLVPPNAEMSETRMVELRALIDHLAGAIHTNSIIRASESE